MTDRIHELLYRNLQEVFGEGDASRRQAAIEELYTEDCEVYVPPGVLVGHEALNKFAGDLRATPPTSPIPRTAPRKSSTTRHACNGAQVRTVRSRLTRART